MMKLCHAGRRSLWGFGSAAAFLIALCGGLAADTSEIESYDRAVTSQNKEDAIAFLTNFKSSHLVGDLIDSLRPDVARQVCAEIANDISEARHACQTVAASANANGSAPAREAVAPAAVPAAAVEPAIVQPVSMMSGESAADPAILKDGDGSAVPRAVDSMEQRRVAAATIRVQLLSTKSQAGTEKDWRRLQAAYPDLLAGLDLEVAKVDLGPDKGLWYRGLAGPMTSKDEASSFCRDFRAQNARNQCIVADR